MSGLESMKEAMKPILDAQTEQTEEWCEKHQRPKVRIKKTGTVLCLKCGYEERREFGFRAVLFRMVPKLVPKVQA